MKRNHWLTMYTVITIFRFKKRKEITACSVKVVKDDKYMSKVLGFPH